MNQVFNSQNQRIEETKGKQKKDIHIRAEINSLQSRKIILINAFKD